MIKAILFDMDGVLFDTEVYDNMLLCEFLEVTGSPLPKERVKKLICPDRETDYVGEMLAGYEDVIDREPFYKAMWDYLFAQRHRTSYEDLMYRDVKPALRWLRENGYLLACASSSPYKYVIDGLTEAKIDGYFDVIVSGQDFKRNKPAPDCYLYCAEKLNVKPEECLVVEDSHNGILSGKNAGMPVLVRKEYSLGLDQSGGDYYADDYSDLEKIIKIFDEK